MTVRRPGVVDPITFDLTREEIDLARALRWLKDHTSGGGARLSAMARASLTSPRADEQRYLERLKLDAPRGVSAWLTARLVCLGLRATAEPGRLTTSRTGAQDP